MKVIPIVDGRTHRQELTQAEIDSLVALTKNISQLAMLVPLDQARAIVRQMGFEETILPIFNPTLWLQTHSET